MKRIATCLISIFALLMISVFPVQAESIIQPNLNLVDNLNQFVFVSNSIRVSPNDFKLLSSTKFFDSIALRQENIGILTARDPNSRINLRSKPTTSSQSLGYGLTGDGVEITECSSEYGDTWLKVQFFKPPYATGWIRADFIITPISLEYC